jgi:GNAT superfamily N-acetyltransferase
LLPDSPTDVVVRSISAASIADWQEVSALGWGHVTPESRRASDAFVRAAQVIDGDGMVIAHDAADGRPLGCASLTRRDGVATLGGMSTIPAERRRGVQAALVRHRIEVALDSGCDLITTSTAVGGASERNVGRLGFEPVLTITTWGRPGP